jgi:uncharacterized protein
MRDDAPKLFEGPVIGWRGWLVIRRPEGLRMTAYDDTAIVWEPGEPFVAVCGAAKWVERIYKQNVAAAAFTDDYREHPAPQPDCRCGVYAGETVEVLIDYFYRYWFSAEKERREGVVGRVLGRVRLDGNIAGAAPGDKDHTWRGERASVLSLTNDPTNRNPLTPADLEELAATYGVPITAAPRIKLPPLLPMQVIAQAGIGQRNATTPGPGLGAFTSLGSIVDRVLEAATPHSLASSDHGPDHWGRVAVNGRRIARLEPGVDAHDVVLFALLHDAFRVNDGRDPEHGLRAAEWLQREAADVPTNLSHLVYALTWHDKGQTITDPTVGACWDADRLELFRVGKVPRAKLLSTQAGRQLLRDDRGGSTMPGGARSTMPVGRGSTMPGGARSTMPVGRGSPMPGGARSTMPVGRGSPMPGGARSTMPVAKRPSGW